MFKIIFTVTFGYCLTVEGSSGWWRRKRRKIRNCWRKVLDRKVLRVLSFEGVVHMTVVGG